MAQPLERRVGRRFEPFGPAKARLERHIDRPARLSILEMLLFAGDDRFGALGISISAEQYIPRHLGPYPQLADVEARI